MDAASHAHAPRSRWSLMTPMLAYACLTFAFGDLLFGLDTGLFGGLQALPSWLRKFGTLNAKGKYALTTGRASIMNSVPWSGKFTGTLIFEPLNERFGYKAVIYISAVTQILGVLIELVAPNWIAFAVGRVFTYVAAGIVENCITSYHAEVAPAPLRGFFGGSFMLLVTLGNLWGAGMSRAYATELRSRGWMIPVGVQFIPAALIIMSVPFAPESPRWLVSRGRKEEALKALDRLRPKEDVANGLTYAEVEAMEEALAEAKMQNQGSWLDLFRGNNFRRTMVASWLFFFTQATGNQFVLSYGPTFYKRMGLGDLAFTYSTISMAISCVAIIFAIALLDKLGRRPILMLGCFCQTLFMFMCAGFVTKKNPSKADINGAVAGLLMFAFSVRFSINTTVHLIAAEIGALHLRKKTMAFSAAFDVLIAFAVTYSIPYLLDRLGAYVAYIFGGICAVSFIFVTLFIPELKGRSLEEVDELFAQNLWAWQFSKATTHGVGARMHALERGDDVVHPGDDKHDDYSVPAAGEKDMAAVRHVEVKGGSVV